MNRIMTVIALVLMLAASCSKQDALEVERLQASLDQARSRTVALPDAADVTQARQGEYYISFDQARYGVDAGGSVTISYSVQEDSRLEASAGQGWEVELKPVSGTQGQIVVTAPDPACTPDIVLTATAADGRLTATRLPLMVRRPYSDATRTDIPAMAYYALSSQTGTDANFKKMAEAGINMLTIEQYDDWPVLLDLAAKYGLKAILFVNGSAGEYYQTNDPGSLDDILNRSKDHPALFGYQIDDEPRLTDIESIVFKKERIEMVAPGKPVYVNLHPSSASAMALGTGSYEEYVDRLVDECSLEMISYDEYPVYPEGLVSSWHKSLSIISAKSRRSGLPFWGFLASCWIDLESPASVREKPTVENMRLQGNTILAYGAQVIQCFTWQSYSGSSYAPIMRSGEYTQAYDDLKTYLMQMHKRAWVFSGSRVNKVRSLGDLFIQPWTGPLCAGDLPPQIAGIEAGSDAIVSFIENSGNSYAVIVNQDWRRKLNLDIDFTQMVYSIDTDGNFCEQMPGRHKFTVDEGDMLVIKII